MRPLRRTHHVQAKQDESRLQRMAMMSKFFLLSGVLWPLTSYNIVSVAGDYIPPAHPTLTPMKKGSK